MSIYRYYNLSNDILAYLSTSYPPIVCYCIYFHAIKIIIRGIVKQQLKEDLILTVYVRCNIYSHWIYFIGINDLYHSLTGSKIAISSNFQAESIIWRRDDYVRCRIQCLLSTKFPGVYFDMKRNHVRLSSSYFNHIRYFSVSYQ